MFLKISKNSQENTFARVFCLFVCFVFVVVVVVLLWILFIFVVKDDFKA